MADPSAIPSSLGVWLTVLEVGTSNCIQLLEIRENTCYYDGYDNRTAHSAFAKLQLGLSTGRSQGSHWLRDLGLFPAFSLALRKPGNFFPPNHVTTEPLV